ncbi:efflux RND transporter periplasmic adaptor subunit [Catenuloplanes sp. NPDC051500]|uniref:efflux RND transporter periplasmic adaptor subunit n=1 Tax=Catenuloplanes sp. NPDC051500 TaxID=3363959 RepID=UPI0037A0E02B
MSLDEDRPHSHRRRNRIVSGIVAAGSVLAVTAAVLVWTRGVRAADEKPAETITVSSVAIVRTDLSTSRSLDGTLGYGTPRVVKSGREGVVTGLPDGGKTVDRGQTLYQVNDEPVPLFIGAPPLYRTISGANLTGRDVAMVAKNLKALGYAIGDQPRAGRQVQQTVQADAEPNPSPSAAPPAPSTEWVTVREGEGVLTSALTAAIKKWQRDLGVDDDGVIQVGDLAVLPGAVRVDSIAVQVGDPATGDLMSVTQTTKAITASASVAETDGLKPGDKVTLRMPDGKETPGEIGEISSVAQTPDGSTAGAPQQVTVTVTMTDPNAAGRLDGGGVEVKVAGETRAGVLAVPVTALLALREGGYAIQLEDGRRIAVTIGMFSGGLVEVSGDGVTEGLMVVTTS